MMQHNNMVVKQMALLIDELEKGGFILPGHMST
jgi:hypothetical protein